MKTAHGLSAICFALLLLQFRYAQAPADPIAQTPTAPLSESSLDGLYVRRVIRGMLLHFSAGIGGVCFGQDGRWRFATDRGGVAPGWHVLRAYSAPQYASQVLWQIQSVCRMTQSLPMALQVLALLYWTPTAPLPAWNGIDEPVLIEGADVELLPERFSFPLGIEEHKCDDPIKWSGGLL